jgi:hypothetical protein
MMTGEPVNVLKVTWVVCKDENETEISRTDRFHFLYFDSVFRHKKLSVSIGFTIIFNHFLYSLIAKMYKCTELTALIFYFVSPFSTVSDRFHP